MSEVEAVSNQYEALAVSCSQLYFALETLRDVHFLYHFSLRFFQDILAQVWCGGVAVVWSWIHGGLSVVGRCLVSTLCFRCRFDSVFNTLGRCSRFRSCLT